VAVKSDAFTKVPVKDDWQLQKALEILRKNQAGI
jgi:hypothetical protein